MSWARPIVACCALGLLVALWPGQAPQARQPSAKRECAICHIMWLTDFKREDVQTLVPYEPRPVVATGRQDVVSTERMCFSCHDGFVLDSRFVWAERARLHPVGVKPSSAVQVPLVDGKEVLPLNDDGKIYCGTCHSAHGVEWENKESPIFLRAENINSGLCVLCHSNRAKGPMSGNHPLHSRPPHSPDVLLAAGGQLGDKGGVICQSCHRVHGSPQKKLLVLPLAGGRLCTACHADKNRIRGTPHDMGAMNIDDPNVRRETSAHAGVCSACHLPHKATGPRLWARPRPEGMDMISSLCRSCHDEQGPAHEKTIGSQSHPVDVSITRVGIRAELGRWRSRISWLSGLDEMVPLPLIDRRGNHARRDGRVTCVTCHDPHRWAPPGGVPMPALADPRKVEGDGRNSFLRLPHDGRNRLCSNCHRDKPAVAFSKHNLAITAAKARNVMGQTVAEAGACSACHLPHNGRGPRMWARVPGKAAGIEGLCTSCHAEGLPAAKQQIGDHSHPVHVGLDRLPGAIRPGLPLFSRQGGRDPQGSEVDCATCHDPHVWDAAHPGSRAGADPEAEGDGRTSFLRVAAADDSPLCVRCHADKALVVGTEHDLRVTAPAARNGKQQTIAASGVCGQCHTPHAPLAEVRLWARPPGPGKDVQESLCRSCHRKAGLAGKKVPEELHHPPRRVPANAGRWIGIRAQNRNPPVFTVDGKRVPVGRITCPTCHDPHRWNPARARRGDGRRHEGTVLDSFLRHAATEGFLCSDCHGLDSLFRYKYFHWPASREPHSLYEEAGKAEAVGLRRR